MGSICKLTKSIKKTIEKYSSIVKIIPAEKLPPKILNRYKSQIISAPSSFEYLSANIQKRADIKEWFPKAKSVLICGFNYWNSNLPEKNLYLTSAEIAKLQILRKQKKNPNFSLENTSKHKYKISRYVVSSEYQTIIKKIFKQIISEIKEIKPDIEAKCFVDTSPVTEKPLAVKAGLGFQGKNTLIINPKLGSFFFLGGIALNTKLEYDDPENFTGCKNCNLCEKHCPTGALSDYKLNIKNCISAWKDKPLSEIPKHISKHFKNLALGCDICQEACPYNRGVAEPIIEQLKPLEIIS